MLKLSHLCSVYVTTSTVNIFLAILTSLPDVTDVALTSQNIYKSATFGPNFKDFALSFGQSYVVNFNWKMVIWSICILHLMCSFEIEKLKHAIVPKMDKI